MSESSRPTYVGSHRFNGAEPPLNGPAWNARMRTVHRAHTREAEYECGLMPRRHAARESREISAPQVVL